MIRPQSIENANVSHIGIKCNGVKIVNNTNSRIAEQSKQKYVEALISLMNSWQYTEITVTQLTQEAQLSRKTFYRLFSDKRDVLILILDKLFDEFFIEIKEQNIKRYWEVVKYYFDFWDNHRELLLLLSKNNLLGIMFEYVYHNSEKIFVAVRTAEKAEELSSSLPYLLAYSVGGMHSMLIKWVESGMTVRSELLIAQLKAGFQSPEL